MAQEESARERLIKELLKAELRLSRNARFDGRLPPGIDGQGIRPDYVVRDNKQLYLVEVQNLATEMSVANLALMKNLLHGEDRKTTFVLAAKNIPTGVRNLARRLDISVIQLPLNIPVRTIEYDGRITTPNAWKVVAAALTKQLNSIRGISLLAGVSYGWAHQITNRLISKGIAEKLHERVRIADFGRLLNTVALERPMADMEMGSLRSGYATSQDAAAGLTNLFEKSKIGFAFTGFTAASIYNGSAIRHDAVYLYLIDELDLVLLKSDEGTSHHGIKIQVYKPDRDIVIGSQRKSGVRVVSKEQALLDMAGFGRSGGVLALEMAKNYAASVDNR